ncbi:hypothetical protein [Neptuniibacter sp. QD37_11]|uniref:hypothetical protein n=1 Tax=Neptuniibacter sp. QD37_11 TaxID=3398209 RepID=UPI0039F53DA7
MGSCHCSVCNQGREVKQAQIALKKTNLSYISDLFEAVSVVLEAENTDHHYYRSICMGIWPESDLIIQNTRLRIAQKDANQIHNDSSLHKQHQEQTKSCKKSSS